MEVVQGSLREKSEIYYKRADIYDQLSEAEDVYGKVSSALLPHISHKTILDVGCGTGKYLRLCAPHVRHITGIDAAEAQLAIVRDRVAGLANVTLVHGDAVSAPLPRSSYDVVIACWMLATILDEQKRLAVLHRIEGLLSPGGIIFVIENHPSGMFEEIRGRITTTTAYNRWLQDTAGFAPAVQLATRFRFESTTEAKSVIGAIWGAEVASKINGPEVGHNVVIFRKDLR